MSDLEWRRIRVDWEELEDAFTDSSADHRYYLDRETGRSTLRPFSTTKTRRKTSAPSPPRPLCSHPARAPSGSVARASRVRGILARGTRRELESSLQAPEVTAGSKRPSPKIPRRSTSGARFVKERMGTRIKSWLADVAVQPSTGARKSPRSVSHSEVAFVVEPRFQRRQRGNPIAPESPGGMAADQGLSCPRPDESRNSLAGLALPSAIAAFRRNSSIACAANGTLPRGLEELLPPHPENPARSIEARGSLGRKAETRSGRRSDSRGRPPGSRRIRRSVPR
jgi:hypothetical protein